MNKMDINKLKLMAERSAFKLLNLELGEHKIATAESMTGGLIFSTLVNIPLKGPNKYGSVSAYDTEAKRTLLGVKTNDIYSHECAKEMAIGVLKG